MHAEEILTQIPKNRREEAPRKLFKIKYQQLCLGPSDKVMFVSKPHMVTAEAHHEISKEMQCTPTEIFSRGLNIDNNCFKTVIREEGLRKLFTIMLQNLGLEQPLPNTCPKSSCWCMLARFLRPWSRVAVWEQFSLCSGSGLKISQKCIAWALILYVGPSFWPFEKVDLRWPPVQLSETKLLKRFFEDLSLARLPNAHSISFDSSCWVLAVTISGMALCPVVANQVVETLFRIAVFGRPSGSPF